MARLQRDFYLGDTVHIAQALLGKVLVRRLNGEVLAGLITETEAYVGRLDKACHAYGYRRTQRTETLFGPPGHAYIYLIYGMYCCLNFVTEPEGEPSAVLLRGLEPLQGTAQMALQRFGCLPNEMNAYQRKNFLNGPGKICKALSLTRHDNSIDLCEDELFILDSPADLGLSAAPPRKIFSGPRIGIDYAEEAVTFPWRFYFG